MVLGTPIVLNLIPSGARAVAHVNEIDQGAELQFAIYNGNTAYNVPEGVTATVRGTKGDGFGYTAAAAVTVGSNIITVTLDEQMTAVAGVNNIFELVLANSNGFRAGTSNFVLDVERAALNENTVISDSDIAYAEQVLNDLQSVQAVNTQVQQNKTGLAAEISRATAAEAAEATARQTADNTLQSNINTEASTRAAADSLLQSEIDQLVAPSGSAPSAAEIENARIGADGVTYPTLGDAIRTQDSNLKSQIDASYIIKSDVTLFEQGNINTSNGGDTAFTNSIRTIKVLYAAVKFVRCAAGYKVGVFAYNGSTYVGRWTGSEYSTSIATKFTGLVALPKDGYTYRLTLEKSDNTSIVPSDASNLMFYQNVDPTLSLAGYAPDSKEVGNRLNTLDTSTNGLRTDVDDLDEATFVYAFSEKTLASVSTKIEGANASAPSNQISIATNVGFDTYWFVAEHDTKLYIDASNVTYAAICIGTNPTSGVNWDGSSAIIPCQSAYRVRKSESNLPTQSNPIVISRGTLVVITLTATKTCPLYLWEKTSTAKIDSIVSNGVICTVTNDTVTITGDSYEVIFSKLTTTQGYQWNITSLSGKDGINMFPAGVDIIGVIQFVGGSNFMGGGHGNESNYEFRVMGEGADITGTVTVEEIHIIMSSHLYNPDNTSQNAVDRFVEFVFTTKGWTCRNTFKVLVDAQIQIAYPSGLFAFTASDCDGAYSNVGTLNLSSTSARQLESTDFKEITMNLPGKFTLNIHSETADKGFVAYRSNTTSFKIYFANAELENVTAGTYISGKCEYRF